MLPGISALLFLAAVALGLTACALPQPTPLPTPRALTAVPTRPASATPSAWAPLPLTPTFTLTPTASPSPTATPVPPDQAVATQHHLRVTYDPAAQWVGVEHTLRYTNPTAETLSTLPLIVPPWYYFALVWQRLEIDGQALDLAQVPAKPSRLVLELPLPAALPPGETVTLYMRYGLWLPRLRVTGNETNRPMVFGHSPRQTNLVDWYPFVPAYVPGEGWVARPAWPYGEFLTYPRADFTLEWQGPANWVLATNMEPTACPAEAAPQTRCFALRAARGAVLSLSPYYTRVETPGPRSADGSPITVEAFVFAGHRGPAQVALQHAAQALEDYAAAFGPYHRRRLTLVEGDFPFSMEYDGLFFVRGSHFDLTPEKFLTAITVHEVAHQWWFAQVGNDQALHPWMDEALATHCEAWYYRRRLPDWVAWWESGRWEGLTPEGPIDGSIYEYGGFFAYRRAVYQHGERFWAQVHAQLGDAGWTALLRAYRDAHFGGIARPQDLLGRVAAAWPDAPWPRFFQHTFPQPGE